jgi:hypothetical protein
MFFNTIQKLVLTAGVASLAIGLGQPAQALTFSEPPDAGSLLRNAADTTATGAVGNDPLTNLTQINGRLGSAADLFKINVTGGLFTAIAKGRTRNPVNDPQLFLFDAMGRGIVANDDGGSSLTARIQAVLTAGIYYLGVSKYDLDPVDAANNEIFPDTPFSAIVTPKDPNAVLARWRGSIDESTASRGYQIDLGVTPIPTPALLPGLIGMGVGMWRKRKQDLTAQTEEA